MGTSYLGTPKCMNHLITMIDAIEGMKHHLAGVLGIIVIGRVGIPTRKE